MKVSRITAPLFAGFLAIAANSPAHAAVDAFIWFKEALPPPPPTAPAPQPELTASPNPSNAAVALPAFMKNARKASTAESPGQLRLKQR